MGGEEKTNYIAVLNNIIQYLGGMECMQFMYDAESQ